MPDFRRATLQDFIDFLASQSEEVRMLPLEYVYISEPYAPFDKDVQVLYDEDVVCIKDI